MAVGRQHLKYHQLSPTIMVMVVIVAVVCLSGVVSGRAQSGGNAVRGGEVRRRKVFLDGQIHRGKNVVPNGPWPRTHQSERPNIVIIMTDDQDVLLGSMKAMPKLQDHLTERGAFFENNFVSTPMCCPSRSSFFTGMYVHNHNVFTNNENCSSPQWIRQHEPRTFATYLHKSGYTTGFFGKYLNKYNGTYTPEGWDKWVGLVRNSRFYNYTLSFNGQLHKFYDNYYKDYLTDHIANDSVAFFKETKRQNPTKPVMMVLSVPAPHGPEDAAPQYQHMFVNNTDHRTPTWNQAPNYDKQWLLRHTQPMTPQYKIFTDLLQRRRLQTLQSVDDLIEKVSTELGMQGELENTYVLYTSDHGYHLGQFGLIKGKSMAFDFDTRVPLIITGPGIKPGSRIRNMAVNLDLAPTILDMAGVTIPDHMDGHSLLPLLKASYGLDENNFATTVRPWRDSILLERGKVSMRIWKMRIKEERTQLMLQNQKNLHLYLSPKQQKILRQCSKPRKAFQLPCKPNQRWYCQQDSKGRMRLHKCRHSNREGGYDSNNVLLQRDQAHSCMCSDGRIGVRFAASAYPLPFSSSLDGEETGARAGERRRHRRFLRQQMKKTRNQIIRQRRSMMHDAVQLGSSSQSLTPSPGFDLFTRRCRILSNQTVSCDQDIYKDYYEWEEHRERVDEMIKEYRKILDDLRSIRAHLSEHRPPLFIDSEENDSEEEERRDNPTVDARPGQDVDGDEECDCDYDFDKDRGGDRQLDRQHQRQIRREQKLLQRAQRREERNQRRDRRGRKKKNCNGNNMKCFNHDNNHWKTPPYWQLFEEKEGGDAAKGCPSLRRYKRFNYPPCHQEGQECALMDNCHWKTPPFWTHGPFCFCSNSNNNTYWCIRTVNTTSDFLYCEYITNFISFYDMTTDPHQQHNIAKKLNYGVLQQLHDQLAILKVCQGADNCDLNNHKDLRIPLGAGFDDSSGEGGDDEDDEYYDEEDRSGFYHRHVDEEMLQKAYDTGDDGDQVEYDDFDDEEETDPDFF